MGPQRQQTLNAARIENLGHVLRDLLPLWDAAPVLLTCCACVLRDDDDCLCYVTGLRTVYAPLPPGQIDERNLMLPRIVHAPLGLLSGFFLEYSAWHLPDS